MRVLICRPGPSFSVQDVAFGWRDGLKDIGCEVVDYNFDDRLELFVQAQLERDGELRKAFAFDAAVQLAADGLYEVCYRFWPDVLIVVMGTFIPTETLDIIRSRGTKVVYLFTESPYEDDRQLAQAPHAELVIVNDPTNLDKFRQVNSQTFYVPHAYDPRKHHPGPSEADPTDFVFIGTGFPSRIEFFEQVDWSGLEVAFGGSWRALDEASPLRPLVGHRLDWCVTNEDTADAYRATKSSLNLYRREATEGSTANGWACGPREIELAACGTFFLRDARPESDELFPMLPAFSEPGEVRPLIDWALAHPDQREKAAMQAREAIIDYTFLNNAKRLLAWLDA